MTRSIGRVQRAAARKKALAEGKLAVIEGGKSAPKPPMLTTMTITMRRDVADAIDQLHQFVLRQYPSRNDFLEDLLKEGLRVALIAQREAIAEMAKAKAIEAGAEQDQQENLVTLVPRMPLQLPPGMAEAAERLNALKREEE